MGRTMHRTVYILLFITLGIILSFLGHALIETAIINLLVKDFSTYGLGLTWSQWYTIHHVGALLLLLLGIVFGLWQGIYWYTYIYIDRRKEKHK